MATDAGQRNGTTGNEPELGTEPWRASSRSSARGETHRIAYFVSRFPVTTETFIVRELDQVAAHPDMTASLYSLFPAPPGARHEVTERWLGRVRRSGPLRATRGLAWCLLRHPARTISSLGLVIRDYRRRPAVLGRALIAFAAAAAHVPKVNGTTDHVHAHFATYPALGAWMCHRLLGTPYSFTVHAHDLYVHQLGLRRRIDEAEFVVTISQFNRQMIEKLGSEDTPVHVIRCGVDLANYDFVPSTPTRTGPVRALCVASLEEKKGHRFLLEALAGDPALERIQLDLVGSGVLQEELEQEALRLGISDRVRFLGSRSEREVADMLHQAQLFVMPSVVDRHGDMEGIPVALMEAMAAGVPVVASRLSGIPELVQDGRTGLLVEPRDVEDLAQALRLSLADHEGCLERVRAARRLVGSEFELHSNAGRLARLLAGTSPADGDATSAVRIESRVADQAEHASAPGPRISRGR